METDTTRTIRKVSEYVEQWQRLADAQAREIVIAVGSWRKGIVLSVTDDGVGVQNELNSTSGLGLSIMKYRARSIGGRLEIESPKKGGTRVACYLPYSALKSNR